METPLFSLLSLLYSAGEGSISLFRTDKFLMDIHSKYHITTVATNIFSRIEPPPPPPPSSRRLDPPLEMPIMQQSDGPSDGSSRRRRGRTEMESIGLQASRSARGKEKGEPNHV